MSLACLEVELLLEVLLDLLQPVQAVLSLQVNLRPLEIDPNDSPYPKTWGLKKIRSLACLEAELLREDVLDLLQPIQAVLDLQVNLGPLKMVPNDSPYPKTWGLKKIRCLSCSEAELLHEELDHPLRPLSSIFHTIEWCSQVHIGCSESVYV